MSDRAETGAIAGREAVRLAFETMRTHKLRSGLLVLGVAIGVTVLIGMVSLMSGLGAKIESEISSTDRSVVTLSKFDFLTAGPNDEKVLARPDVTPEDAKALEELCESVGIAEFYIDPNTATVMYHGDRRTPPSFVGGAGTRLLLVYSLSMATGRYFTDAEVLTRSRVCVLGWGPARELFPNRDPIGKRVRIGEDHYEVIGVMEERKSIFGGMADNFALIPWTTFRKYFVREQDPLYPYYVYMTVADGYEADDVVDEARTVMRRRRGLKWNEEDDFAIIANDRVNAFVQGITGQIGLVLVALSSIGLCVGGIGVMNIMLVSVTERTREIGIRKALGAQRRAILAQFLVEAGTLTGIGGVLGVGAGLALAHLLALTVSFPASVHPAIALVGVLFSVGIGVFFGMYPAVRAARLDPIEALRWE